MYSIKTSACFDSAHFLYGYNGKCSNIHGHRWKLEVTVDGMLQDDGEKRGMVVDFGDLKKAVRELADTFDHALIFEKGSLKKNTIEALKEENFRLIEVNFRPTAECFAKYFYDVLKVQGFSVCEAAVYETPENCAVYRGEQL